MGCFPAHRTQLNHTRDRSPRRPPRDRQATWTIHPHREREREKVRERERESRHDPSTTAPEPAPRPRARRHARGSLDTFSDVSVAFFSNTTASARAPPSPTLLSTRAIVSSRPTSCDRTHNANNYAPLSAREKPAHPAPRHDSSANSAISPTADVKQHNGLADGDSFTNIDHRRGRQLAGYNGELLDRGRGRQQHGSQSPASSFAKYFVVQDNCSVPSLECGTRLRRCCV
jgi:hypothetical protein